VSQIVDGDMMHHAHTHETEQQPADVAHITKKSFLTLNALF
jgi:hypothetical protein